MTSAQEDAFQDFLDASTTAFTSEELVDYIRSRHPGGTRRLEEDLRAILHARRLAFPCEDGRWLTRRGAFEGRAVLAKPSRVELENGVFFPGHRALPLMNPLRMPHELSFTYKGEAVPRTSIEAAPDELYGYYDLFGEEYAPQYIARDNRENEKAYNADPYEDPPEVSVQCLDLRSMYREVGFRPGDYLLLRCSDWQQGIFAIEHIPAQEAHAGMGPGALLPGDIPGQKGPEDWEKALRAGFARAFDYVGPGNSTEEQIAFAWWFAGDRAFSLPAFSLEEFLWERDNGIETVPFGMETRFWHVGKDIPLGGPWEHNGDDGTRTEMEKRLDSVGIHSSEYILDGFVLDSFWRGQSDPALTLDRIIPTGLVVDEVTRFWLFRFIIEAIEDLGPGYNSFADRTRGPLRNRACELFSAITGLEAALGTARNARDPSPEWLPAHLFVTLSQLRLHCGNLLEDIDWEDSFETQSPEAVDNALTNLEDSYADLREELEDARRAWRKNKLSIVRPRKPSQYHPGQAPDSTEEDTGRDGEAGISNTSWYAIQASLVGTKVWRRLHVPANISLAKLHALIQNTMGWSAERLHGFVAGDAVYGQGQAQEGLDEGLTSIGDLVDAGKRELNYDYDYSAEWEFKLRLLHEVPAPTEAQVSCQAGEGAAPPERVGGPLRWRRLIQALAKGPESERREAIAVLGEDFDPAHFDLAALNARLALFTLEE